ncbi:MAG TPA: ABC transporter permease [Gemmatimonadaceae bacterium]|nr:ABC transporter permease [Gemmatimonadaceae bacterium]
MSDILAGFLEATVRTATPLALAALGETLSQRSGVVNVGLEGIVLAGAFGALVGGYPGPMLGGEGSLLAGYLVAITSGMVLAAVFALVTVSLRANQIITGTALTLLAAGLTGTLYRAGYGTAGAALAVPMADPVVVPLLSGIPIVGQAFFAQPPTTLLIYALLPLSWLLLFRTHAGLAIRAVGENPEAAIAAGIDPGRVRWAVLLAAGALGGLGGATLVLEQAGTFSEGISAGRGFIAIAIVVLARWNPFGVGVAALLFGAASALQFLIQSLGLRVPYQLPLALPYVLTLVLLAVWGSRARAPAALGQE